MEAEGLEPSDSAARQRFGLETINHFKLETLPSGGWGYMYFPVTMHYARTLGLECLGQTGKFHTSWETSTLSKASRLCSTSALGCRPWEPSA
jgi:hypothetical protein